MDQLSKEELKALAQTANPACVSIFMPIHHVESELSQNPIRLKNLIRQVRQELREQGVDDGQIDAQLKPLKPLIGEEQRFWLDQSDGLAIFLTPDRAHIYRLPLAFEELVVTGRRFHLKPLFPMIASNNAFYLLALSQNNVRLFQGTHHTLSVIETEDIPKSLVEALFYEDRERSVQHHTGNIAGGRQDAIFHGHGNTTGDDDKREPHDEIRRFFRDVDKGVREALQDQNEPLVLAGVEYYLPIYRAVNSYTNLIDDGIVAGNPDHLATKDLHKKAWEIVEPRFLADQSTSMDTYQRQAGIGGGLASDDIHEIVPAAYFSRVDTLLVPIGVHAWGRYDADANTVERHDERQPGDEDLLDLAAVHTYLHGGTVHALRPENMPEERMLAATFRYAADMAASTS